MKIIFVVLMVLFLGNLFAMDAGTPLPRVDADKWYTGKDIPAKIQVVVLMDLTSSDAPALLQLVKNIVTTRKDVSAAVLCMNKEKTADPIMKSLGQFPFRIGLDSSLRMRNLLAASESLFPYAIVAHEGVVVWSGLPVEIESVTEKVAAGTFSASSQKKTEGLRKELQLAIQSGLPVVVSATADKILAIIPDDRLAIQSKLFALNAMHMKKEALDFIQKICRKNPQDVQLKIVQLDFLLRERLTDEYVKAVSTCGENYKNSSDNVLLASFIVENSPFGLILPEQQILLAEKASSLLWKQDPSASGKMIGAVAAETLARAYSSAGRFQEAVKWQEKALTVRKGSAQEKAAEQRLSYYRNALKISDR